MNFLEKFKLNSLPLVVGFILLIISLLIDLFTNYGINQKHFFGFIAIAICIYTYLKDKKHYIYSFISTLFLGLFSFIDFFIFQFNFSFGIDDFLNININPLFIFLLVLFFGLNKELMNKEFPKKKL